MNHEFLLKPRLPVNQVSPERTQAVADSQGWVESETRQSFSSELDKKIDKQLLQNKSIKQDGAIAKGSEASASVKPANEAKAEIILDKNGNPLPSEKEIVQELTSQLLGDFDGNPAIKKELTQVIEQFVHSIVNNETPDVDLKDSVTRFINQLLQSGIGSDTSLVLTSTNSVKTDLKSAMSGVSDIIDKRPAGGTILRSDILQALTSKSSAARSGNNALNTKTTSATTKNGSLQTITNNFLKGEVTTANADEKHIERITQLVDLLRPTKSDEQLGRTMILEKAAPAVSSPLIGTTPLTATSSIMKADLPSLDIQPSLQSKAWNNVLSSRAIWMAREGIQQAALKLNPVNLGPVEVRLNMHKEQANITFIAHNAATRDALELALPKLRESFLENGLELTGADVSDPSSQQAKDDDREQNGEDINGSSMASTLEKSNENAEGAAAMVTPDIDSGLSVYA